MTRCVSFQKFLYVMYAFGMRFGEPHTRGDVPMKLLELLNVIEAPATPPSRATWQVRQNFPNTFLYTPESRFQPAGTTFCEGIAPGPKFPWYQLSISSLIALEPGWMSRTSLLSVANAVSSSVERLPFNGDGA